MKLEQKMLKEFPAPLNLLFLERFSLQLDWRREAPTFSMAASY
jgi:hypothetical protein